MTQFRPTLGKSERIYHRKDIDALFKEGNSHSMSAFPIRAVYMLIPTTDNDEQQDERPQRPQAKFLISVPKHCFRRAVKRNRIKRLVREAYRHNKSLVAQWPLAIAFIWMDRRMPDAATVNKSVVNLLARIHEKMAGTNKEQPTPNSLSSNG